MCRWKTIRRGSDFLKQSEQLKRVHGGAISVQAESEKI